VEAGSSKVVRFGVFEMDLEAGELRKAGIRIKLQEQPFRLLALLVNHSRKLLTRDRIREELWADDTFVDYEQAISTAVKKIREALNDSATNPRFIETVPRRGFRFIASVEQAEELPIDRASISSPESQTRPTRSAWLSGAMLLTVGLGSGWAISRWATPTPGADAAPPRIQFTFAAASSAEWGGGAPAVSPRGRKVAFVAPGDDGLDRVFVRTLASQELRMLEGTDGAYNPFWSPDGDSVGFFASGKLKRVSINGGPSEVLCDAQGGAGASWSSTGEIVFTPGTRAPLLRVPASGGETVPATVLDSALGENSHRWPMFLPDGRRFLYLARAATPEASAIYVASLDGDRPRRVLTAQSNAAYVPTANGASILTIDQGSLMAHPVRPDTLALLGTPEPVASRVRYVPIRHLGLFSAASDGSVIGFREGEAEQRQLHWLDLSGNVVGSPGPPRSYDQVRLSPGGRHVAFTLPDIATGKRDVWLLRLDSGGLERLTVNPANDWCPIWSPDGGRIAFASDRSGVSEIYVRDWTTTRDPAVLFSSAEPKFPSDWSRDGAQIAYHHRSGSKIDVSILSVAGEPASNPFLVSEFAEPEAYFSPDGNWVAYSSNETGRFEVYVRTNPPPTSPGDRGPDEKHQVSNAGGTDPRWHPDSQTLFYLAMDGNLMAVDRLDDWSAPRMLFLSCSAGFLWDGSRQSYDVGLGGRRFLMSCPVQETVSAEITAISGWRPGQEN